MKGQSSIEFLSLVAMSSLILAAMYGVMASKEKKAFEYKNRRTAQEVAEKAGFQVELALVQGEGYSRVFSVPTAIGGSEYNITVRDQATVVEWANKTVSRSTLYDMDELNVTTSKSNVLRVSNKEGEIKLEEVT